MIGSLVFTIVLTFDRWLHLVRGLCDFRVISLCTGMCCVTIVHGRHFDLEHFPKISVGSPNIITRRFNERIKDF